LLQYTLKFDIEPQIVCRLFPLTRFCAIH